MPLTSAYAPPPCAAADAAMTADANAREATPMAALLTIARLPHAHDLGKAIEHLQPARMRTGVLGKRFRNVLLERQQRRAANLRKRDRHERLTRPPRIMSRLRGLDLVPGAVSRRERAHDALGPDDLLVHADTPAIAERRIVDAPMKPTTRPRIELHELDRAAARRVPLHQILGPRPRVKHELTRCVEPALDTQRAGVVSVSCGHGVASPSSRKHRVDRTLRPRTAGSPPSSRRRPSAARRAASRTADGPACASRSGSRAPGRPDASRWPAAKRRKARRAR